MLKPLDEKTTRALGRELLRCGGKLASRARIGEDEAELTAIAGVMAEGLQLLEGALGRVVLARPRAVVPSGPVPAAAGEVYPALIDGEVS
jgi:hypothetical protein